MDLTLLAQAIAFLIAPLLPELLAEGETLLEGAETGLGRPVRDRIARVWRRLHPRIAASPAASGVVEMAASAPQDLRARAALELQIETMLKKDEALARDMAELVEMPDAAIRPSAAARLRAFADALGAVRRAIVESALEARTTRVLIGDLDVLEEEVATDTPNRAVIDAKVYSLGAISRSVGGPESLIAAIETTAAQVPALFG